MRALYSQEDEIHGLNIRILSETEVPNKQITPDDSVGLLLFACQ